MAPYFGVLIIKIVLFRDYNRVKTYSKPHEVGHRIGAGIPYILLLRIEAIGFPTFRPSTARHVERFRAYLEVQG